MTPRVVPLTVLLIVVLSAFVQATEPFRPFASAAPKTVPALEQLAAWCQECRLLRERAGVLEVVLLFESEHAMARRSLGYRFSKEEGWVRRPGWRAPRTTRADLHPEFRERWLAIVGPFIDRTLAALGTRSAELTEERRDGILAGLLEIRPDHEVIRKALGEVRDGEGWALEETVLARTRRAKILETAVALRRSQPPPNAAPLDAIDRALGLAWTGAYASRATRVIGTVKTEELQQAVGLADAAGALFRFALATATTNGEGFTIHLLDGPSDRETYLERHPKLTEQARTFSRTLNSVWSESVWNVGIWVKDRKFRDELVARQTYVMLLGRAFGISTRQGALHEGLGLYLTEALTGLRRAWFVKPAQYGARGGDYSARMKDPRSDWRELARELLRSGETADYRILLGRDVNALTPSDVLHAYVLAAYLLEGRPAGTTRFLGQARGGASVDDAARRELGRSLPALERRVARWLMETAAR